MNNKRTGTRIAVAGAAGRMGRILISLISSSDNACLSGALERRGHEMLGQDTGEMIGIGHNGISLSDDLCAIVKDADVVIDFSRPDSTSKLLAVAVDHGCALVSGVTGLDAGMENEFNRAADVIPLLWSSNMSSGICILLELSRILAAALGDDFDIEITEIHHRHKQDAPSGTALSIARSLGDRKLILGRGPESGSRTDREIGIHSIRMGEIIGEHQVLFTSDLESVQLGHRAFDRTVFANGALKAALWIVHQPPGRYTMADVLQISKLSHK